MTKSNAKPTSTKKKSLIKKLLKLAGFSFLGFVLLIGGLLIFIHTDAGQDWLTAKVEEALQERVRGEVALEQLEFELWGPIAIEGLLIKDEEGREAIALKRVDLSLDWGGLLSGEVTIDTLSVDGVALQIIETEPGVTNLTTLFIPEEDPQPLQLKVNELKVSEISLDMSLMDGTQLQLSEFGLAGALSLNTESQSIELKLSPIELVLDLQHPAGWAVNLPITTGASVKQEGANLSAELDPIATQAQVHLPGQEDLLTPVELAGLTVELKDGAVDLQLSKLVLAALSLDELSAQATLAEGGLLRGPTTLDLRGLLIDHQKVNQLLKQEVLITDIAFDLGLKGPPDALAIDGALRSDGGALTISGLADIHDPLDPALELQVETETITLEQLTALDLPKMRSSLTLEISGHGATKESAEAEMRLEIGPTTIDDFAIEGVELLASYREQRLMVERITVDAFGESIDISADLDTLKGAISSEVKLALTLEDIMGELERRGLAPAGGLPPLKGGKLDLTLQLQADQGEQPELARWLPPELATLPFNQAGLKGSLELTDLDIGIMSLGKLALGLDLGATPEAPRGHIDFAAERVRLDTLKVDSLEGEVNLLDDALQLQALATRDEVPLLQFAANVQQQGERLALGFEQFELDFKGTPIALKAPVTLLLPGLDSPPHTAVELPELAFGVAKGELAVEGTLWVGPTPEQALDLEELDLWLRLKDLDLRRLGRLAGVRLPVSASLSGTVHLTGTPLQPKADLDLVLRARAKGAKSLKVALKGRFADEHLSLSSRVDAAHLDNSLLYFEAELPLDLKNQGLARRKPLSLELSIPELSLAQLLPLLPELPEALAAQLPKEAMASFDLNLHGSAAHPVATIDLDVDGLLLPEGAGALARQRQHLALDIDLEHKKVEGGAVISLDNRGAQDLKLDFSATLNRSPLLKSAQLTQWEATLRLQPFDLSWVPLPPGSPSLQGSFGFVGELSGTERDLSAKLSYALSDLVIDQLPVAASSGELRLNQAGLRLDAAVNFVREPLVNVILQADLSSEDLLRRLQRDPKGLLATTFSAELEVPSHRLSTWADFAPPLAELPGELVFKLNLNGSFAEPLAEGWWGYHGYQAYDGQPSAVGGGLSLDSDKLSLTLLRAGGPGVNQEAPVELGLQIERAPLLAFATGASDRFEIELVGGGSMPLGRALPDFAMSDLPLPLVPEGSLSLALSGSLPIRRADDGAVLPVLEESDAAFAMELTDANIELTGTGRAFHDLGIALKVDPNGVWLERLHLEESDLERSGRSVDLSGHLALEQFMPQQGEFHLVLDEFLAMGALDVPLATASGEGVIRADFTQQPPQVEVAFDALELNMPERYLRGHYMREVGHNDIVYLNEGDGVGVLPQPQQTRQLPTAEDLAAPVLLEAHVTMPEEGMHMVQAPLDVWATGEVFAKVTTLPLVNGELTFERGSMFFLGNDLPLVGGSLVIDPLRPEGYIDVVFGRDAAGTALRDVAVAELDTSQTRVRITGLTTNTQLDHHGLGNNMTESMAMLNAGTPRYVSGPDLPTSAATQYPLPTETFLILTFVHENLPHLTPLTKMRAWSNPNDGPEAYGEIRHVDAIAEVDGHNRVHMRAAPKETGRSPSEFGWEHLLYGGDRALLGLGAYFGGDIAAGARVFWEFSSQR